MRRRTAALLLLGVVGLLAVGLGLSVHLLSAGIQAVRALNEQRLRGIGLTAAHAVASDHRGAGFASQPDEGLLQAVCRDNGLEDAYLLDGDLQPILPRSRARSLLRIDPEAALRALGGQASVGEAYRLEDLDPASEVVLAGYFPVRPAGGGGAGQPRVLVLEAGGVFIEAQTRLRHAAWGASAVAGALGLLSVLLVGLSVRAAARERRLYGQAERGRAVAQMAAMVAHEIRNPLGTIRAGAELVREISPSKDILDDILQEVDRLNGLCSEFLTLSRDPPLQVGDLDLCALCDEVCDGLTLRPEAARVDIQRAGEARLELRGDRARLRQVLLNLSLNALQAMPDGGALHIHVARRSGGAEVLIRDTGPGIDEKLSRRLFEPFATTKAGGSGLGLVLSRRIAEKHGGALLLLPPAAGQRGARFLLRLPLRPPAQPDAAAPTKTDPVADLEGEPDEPNPAV